MKRKGSSFDIKKTPILQKANWPNILVLEGEKAEFHSIVRSIRGDRKQDLSLDLFFKHQQHTFANDFYDCKVIKASISRGGAVGSSLGS